MMEQTVQERARQARAEWKRHKFRPGEYFDRYLYKLLHKYYIELDDYYKECESQDCALVDQQPIQPLNRQAMFREDGTVTDIPTDLSEAPPMVQRQLF